MPIILKESTKFMFSPITRATNVWLKNL